LLGPKKQPPPQISIKSSRYSEANVAPTDDCGIDTVVVNSVEICISQRATVSVTVAATVSAKFVVVHESEIRAVSRYSRGDCWLSLRTWIITMKTKLKLS